MKQYLKLYTGKHTFQSIPLTPSQVAYVGPAKSHGEVATVEYVTSLGTIVTADGQEIIQTESGERLQLIRASDGGQAGSAYTVVQATHEFDSQENLEAMQVRRKKTILTYFLCIYSILC